MVNGSVISASDAGTEIREVTGKISVSKDRLILHSGKEKLILSILAPAALDSLAFHPADDDTLTVKGFMSKGTLVAREAIWKGKTFTFRDSLYQFTRTEKGNWVVIPKKCISCKLCEVFCPVNAITMQQEKDGLKAIIDQTKCSGCNICIAGNNQKYLGCPTQAITK